ncbi:hypothetical protein [Methylomonas sp. HYX-M1]|uniref:hypothetical protein n=1 Tax=Methylomonas sp. HYX-M1 TaxID=3139307 RepID=UPI00345C39C4
MQLETRYRVFKIKDIESYLTVDGQELLDDLSRKINRIRLFDGKEILQGLFVEHDWPEYESTLQAIANRVDGIQPQTTSAANEELINSTETIGRIKAAIEKYHLDLDNRQHGDIAQNRAFDEILGLKWR